MKRLIGIALICAMSVSLITGCSPDNANVTEPSETITTLSSRPQDDFYYYVNKDALDNAVFDYGSGYAANAFDSKSVSERLDGIIKDVVAGSGYEKGSEEYIIQTAYNAYLSYDFANEPIPDELVSVIDEVKNAKTIDELLLTDAKLYRDFGINGFLNLYVYDDSTSTSEKIIIFNPYVSIFGVSFEDISDNNNALNPVVTDTRTYLKTLGYDTDTASDYGKQLANIALSVFGSSGEKLDTNSYTNADEKIESAAELDRIFTNIDLQAYCRAIGYDEYHCKKFSYYNKDQLVCLNSLFVDKNLEALKAWKILDIYNNYMRFIAPHYEDLSGYVPDSYKSVEEQAINEIKSKLVFETDPLYVEQYYSKEIDDGLRSMCDDIKEGYRNLISNATWLTEPTRKELIEKLDNIVYVTGSNVKRHDASKYANISGDFFDVYIGYVRAGQSDTIASLAKPVDRLAIEMPMQTVNACYTPTRNNITITVAISGDSFYDVNGDYYTNLGNLGATIAHEIGHAFDSNCIVFDKDGLYNPDWIADEDMEALLERNKKAVAYFEDNFTIFGIYHVDGARTLGENYADLSGVECIVTLAKTDEDLKKIFESYAASYCCKSIDLAVINQLAYGVHSPDVIRVNAIFSTLDCFYDVYDVKEGDGMYIAPEDRISRWH